MPATHATPDDHEIRVISIYATRWRHRQFTDRQPQPEHLGLGRLEEFYALFRGQLPQVICRTPHAVGDLAFTGPDDLHPADGGAGPGTIGPVTVTRAESWLFGLPSDQVVAVLDFDFVSGPLDVDPTPTTKVLERCAYAQLCVDGLNLERHIAALATKACAEEIDTNTMLPPERHQVVFAPYVPGGQLPGEDILKTIIYRVDPPNRPEFMKVRRPSGLNEAEHTLGAVTPYVSLLYGHQEYIENSVFLTAVHAVGTTARFRQIWHKAHGQVRDFRYKVQNPQVGKQRRADMEILVDELGNLELDLSFSVETSADLGLLIPSLRLESFHRELYKAMELRERADTVSRMFSRLDASIRSELTAIEIRERQADEDKRLRRDAAVSVLTFIGVPVGFLVAFFGINATQVNNDWSIFSMRHYWPVYLAAGLLALTPLVAFAVLNGRALRRSRKDRRERQARLRGNSGGA
jgi:heme exporter protein D